MIIELVVRLKTDGTFGAAHTRDETGAVMPVVASQLPALLKTLNTTATAKVVALRAERDASKGSADALANAILAAETKQDCMQLARNQLRPERDAKIAAKQAEIAAKQAELAALQSN